MRGDVHGEADGAKGGEDFESEALEAKRFGGEEENEGGDAAGEAESEDGGRAVDGVMTNGVAEAMDLEAPPHEGADSEEEHKDGGNFDATTCGVWAGANEHENHGEKAADGTERVDG